MNNCKTCKYWNTDHTRKDEIRREMGLCEAIPMYENILDDCPDVWARVREKNQRILQSNMSADDKAKYTESPTREEYDEYYECMRATLRKELAFTQDASSYMADLITHGNFGCVKWEEK